jgi:lipoprotein signal peptidase
MYIDLGFFNTEIFNMADVSIVVGSLIVLIFSFVNKNTTVNLKEDLR